MSGPQSIQLQSTGLSGFGEMLESYYKLQPMIKTVPKFTDALHWSALPEKDIDNDVKDNRNWLQACVSASGGLNM